MTPYTTNYRFYTFLQDPVYRMGIVTQNVAYNQPAHTGFYFGQDLEDIFVPKKITIESPEYELDPVFNAIDYQWSTGETTKKLTLKREDFTEGQEYKIYLDMNYWGHIFTDTVYIQFSEGNSIPAVENPKPVRLLSQPVENELSLAFEDSGIYDCYIYSLSGVLLQKTTLAVGGKSIQTLNASGLPAGTGIVAIYNKAEKILNEKFLKK